MEATTNLSTPTVACLAGQDPSASRSSELDWALLSCSEIDRSNMLNMIVAKGPGSTKEILFVTSILDILPEQCIDMLIAVSNRDALKARSKEALVLPVTGPHIPLLALSSSSLRVGKFS